jgi:arylformamidase
MQRVIDISRTIAAGSPVYPGDPPVRLDRVADFEADRPYRLTEFGGSVHLLTHIDAPAHFIPGGATIDHIPPERFHLPALIVPFGGDAIAPADLPATDTLPGIAVLFKTRHSGAPLPAQFDASHVHLTPEAARVLVAAGVAMVGIDYLDLERPGDADFPVHKTLLQGGVLILEGLDLGDAPAGPATLAAFPLKLANAEAAPCRAVVFL